MWQIELNCTLQHFVCHHICNFIYYIWGAKCGDDCSLPLRFSNNSVCTSNDTLYHITQQFTSLPHIILITSGERYKLWSYSSCCFIHFPFTFRCKSLNKLNSTIPIFSPHSFLKVPHQVLYTHIYKKFSVNMHTFVSRKSRYQTEKQNDIKMQCAILQIHFSSISSFCNLYFLLPLLNTWKFPTLSKCPTLNWFQVMILFHANPVIKRCHTLSVLYRPNFPLPFNTAPNFYWSHVVTRYYSITTTEIKLLCASLIQFFYVPVSIHG